MPGEFDWAGPRFVDPAVPLGNADHGLPTSAPPAEDPNKQNAAANKAAAEKWKQTVKDNIQKWRDQQAANAPNWALDGSSFGDDLYGSGADWPTWGGWGGGAGAPITFDREAFGPGGVFSITPPSNRPIRNSRSSKFDIGGWRGGGALGAVGAVGAVGQAGAGMDSGFVGGSSAPPMVVEILPLTSNGLPDGRFERKSLLRDKLMPAFPGGTQTISLEGTSERFQKLLTYHADPRLVAANRGPSPGFGTPVADVTTGGDLAGARHAALQTIFVVVKSPTSKAKPGATSDQYLAATPNVVAWNIGKTGLGEALAGMATDNSYGRNRHARVARVDGGVFAIGPKGCKHRLGTDGDNDPILPMHLPCEALFSFDDDNPKLDGPLAFNPVNIGEYQEPSGYTWRVDLVWNPAFAYRSGNSSFSGAWGWRTRIPIGVTTPSEPPSIPSIPPPIPRYPPIPPIPNDPAGPGTPGGGNGRTGGRWPTGATAPGATGAGGGSGGGGGGGGPGGPPGGGAAGSGPSTISADASRLLTPRDHVAIPSAVGLTAIVWRPRRLVNGARDLAYGLDGTMREFAEYEKSPAVLRWEVYGRQGGTAGASVLAAGSAGGSDFLRTQEPGRSVARGGTAPGGVWVMPPELGLEDVDSGLAGDVSRPASTSFFGFAPGVRLGFGLPDVPSGGMKSGIGLAGSSGTLTLTYYDSSAAGSLLATFSGSAFTLSGLVTFKLDGATSGTLGIKAAATTTTHTLTMPAATGIGSLRNDGAGALAWVDGPAWTYQAKVAAYTAVVGEFVNANATGGAFNVTLPTAAGKAGRSIKVRKSDASGNAVTVDTTGGETINGAATKVLAAQYDVAEFVSDGTNWMVG